MAAPSPARLAYAGVVGAGTMGAGIAQVLAMSGASVRLVDVSGAVLESAVRKVSHDLERGAARGLWSSDDAAAARERLSPASDLAVLADAEVVIEAAPERLELKRSIFASLADVCSATTVTRDEHLVAAGQRDRGWRAGA